MKKTLKKITLLFAAFLAALLFAEVIIRLTDADWRYIRKNLYYQTADLQSHIPDPDPELFYRLKPGSSNDYDGPFGNYRVLVNSLGFRGPEKSGGKPQGVFRIVCIGGSNVYGFGVNNDQAWPSRLEKELNRKSPGRFEVFNLGVCGYSGVQMAVVAKKALRDFDPDMIIFALSNLNSPPFLSDAPIEHYFKAMPYYWRMLIPPEHFDIPWWLSEKSKIQLFSRVRFYRMTFLALSTFGTENNIPLWHWRGLEFEKRNVLKIREFIENTKGNVSSCFFIGPYLQPPPPGPPGKTNIPPGGKSMVELKSLYEHYYQGTASPVFHLIAPGLPSEYTVLHPPPRVLKWYAVKIADWLEKNDLLPQMPDSGF